MKSIRALVVSVLACVADRCARPTARGHGAHRQLHEPSLCRHGAQDPAVPRSLRGRLHGPRRRHHARRAEIASYALIVIGHASLDTTGQYLDARRAGEPEERGQPRGAGLSTSTMISAAATAPATSSSRTSSALGTARRLRGADPVHQRSAGALHHVPPRLGADRRRRQMAAVPSSPRGRLGAGALLGLGRPLPGGELPTGRGRAVQFASYEWMSPSIRGPLRGLDDLVWRSLAWAARKPFVMQGAPQLPHHARGRRAGRLLVAAHGQPVPAQALGRPLLPEHDRRQRQ